jgi:hypothetical protein
MKDRRVVIFDGSGNVMRVEVHEDLAFRRKLYIRAFAVGMSLSFIMGGWFVYVTFHLRF